MGICSKAKEIVIANNISNIKIDNKENINNNINKAEKSDNNHLLKGTTQKSERPEELSQQNQIIIEKEKEKERKKEKIKFKNYSGKKFSIQSNEIPSNDRINIGEERKRGKSAVSKEITSKFRRSCQKSVTLIHANNNLLIEKLRGMEKKSQLFKKL